MNHDSNAALCENSGQTLYQQRLRILAERDQAKEDSKKADKGRTLLIRIILICLAGEVAIAWTYPPFVWLPPVLATLIFTSICVLVQEQVHDRNSPFAMGSAAAGLCALFVVNTYLLRHLVPLFFVPSYENLYRLISSRSFLLEIIASLAGALWSFIVKTERERESDERAFLRGDTDRMPE